MSVGEIVAIVCGSLTIIGGYTTLVYKLATLTAALNQTASLILDVRNIVVNQDDRLDKHENRLIAIETKCKLNHKEA